ncbi:HD domain-containing phosphohydrolase [Solimicrobium silvestre]|uniref:Response regulator containing a CheY-like receiver domain and an HD-GYP domain n=1 Tax=Solimicrobium silvestre TaxID=2099400 RepID=A0A2S9H084_9BURK|nr:HD domain-containing phosphohydrolase [Solimicrobium silvestre]PRC93360.1 Response regulator containing a CheY-like receiver domain and an HD-GYP domain [Solimicrobium silvestre]
MSLETTDSKSAKILCVDDEPNILSSLRRLFRAKGYQVFIAEGGREGLKIMESEQIDLVISDMRMPEMDGAQFLEEVRSKWPDCIRILLTGFSEVHSIIAAINRGEIHRYIAKPWDENDILLIVKQALERKYLFDEKLRLEALTSSQNEELKNLNASLEFKVQERTEALKTANEKLKESFLTSIKVFSSLIDMRGGKLAGHSRRVADIARKIAVRMKLDFNEVQDIFVAGLLVDIGKIGFSDDLLSMPMNKMNGEELGLYHKHTIRAEQVLMPLEDLQATAKILRSQHERVDGKGFPDGLMEDEIPIGARVLAIASDYDNLQTGSLVQRRVPAEEAQAIIIRSAGSRYSERVVAAFKEVFNHQNGDVQDHHEVTPKNLLVGMVLFTDLISRDGTLLIPADCVLNEHIIEKIILHSVSSGVHMTLKIRNSGRHV